ncbi:MAG: diguanylate cyclase [Holophagales bacterium]|nr:MAG: diguanylate cyclase [Holophagales bacterium]
MIRRAELRHAVVRRFLLLFLPVALLVVAGAGWILSEDSRARRESLRGRQANHLALLESLVELRLEPILGTIRHLAATPQIQVYLRHPGELERRPVEEEMAGLLSGQPSFDQLQWLDESACERIVVRREAGGIGAVAAAAASRCARDDADAIARLNPGQLYLAPLDLAVEDGQVIRPVRPVLRFALPLFDAEKVRRGTLVLSLLVEPLLAQLGRPFVAADERVLVANDRGFWLVGPRVGSEWGFRLPERVAETVGSAFPELWHAFSTREFGSVATRDGLFEFRKVRPAALARSGWSERAGGWGASGAEEAWWLVSWMPPSAVSAVRGSSTRLLLLALAAVLLVLAVAALGEARSTVARQRAERAVRRQLDLMERMGETIASPVFVKNREGRYTALNRAYEELLGVPRETLLGHTDRERVSDPEIATYERLDGEALAGSEGVRFETTVERPGLPPRRVEVHKRSFADESGRVLGLVGVVHDITGLREAQARLAASEARFRAMIEGSLDLIFVLGPQARLEYANPRAENAMGWPASEIVGRSAIEFVHPDDAGLARGMIRLMSEDRTARPRLEARLASRSGEWLDVEVWASPLESADGHFSFLVVAHDIRERRRVQRELAESRARLQRVLEHMPVMLSAVGEDGRYAVWNRECERVTGYSLEELADEKVGTSMARLFPDPVDLDRLRHEWAAREGEFRDWEMEIVCKDGSRKVTSWSSIARQFPIAGWRTWSIAADVTDRRRAEREKAAALETLQSWVGKLQKLNELDDLLHACRNLTEAYAVLEKSLPPLFAADAGQLFRPDAGSDTMTCVLTWGGLGSESLARTSCWGLRLGHPHLHGPETSSVACEHVERGSGNASICAPLLAQGELLGLLHLRKFIRSSATENAWSSELQLAQMVAGHLSLRIAALGLRETLEYRSTRDPLTGLFNRRYFEETLTREIHSSGRHRRPLAIVMVDIDRFKRINDTYGHAVGDVALREVASALQRGLRASDVPSRWGGEEFVLLLPEATVPPATHRAEELRRAVLALAADRVRGLPPELSVSAGVAVYPLHGETAEALLKAADQALYRAKANGRNRVETAE